MSFRSRARARKLRSRVATALWGPRLPSAAFAVIALTLFFFSAVRPDNLQGMRTGAADFFAPVLSAINTPVQYAAGYARAASGLASLQQENDKLREENARLREWYQTAQVLKVENESLQKLLNINLAPQHSFVSARVIADTGNSFVRTMLVMAGKGSGIEKGHAVLSGEGLAGRIIEVGGRAARVLLLTDINSRVPVMIEGTGEQAILAGNNTDLPVLAHLPADARITEGARIITSGHGGFFPFGLPVGTASQTENGGWVVLPYADPDSAAFVRIVNGGDSPDMREGGL